MTCTSHHLVDGLMNFKIEAEELQPLLSDYAQLRKDGLF